MNSADPSDLAPLPYGAGLAIGLLLILGLPTESQPKATSSVAETPPAQPVRYLAARSQ